MLCAQKIVNLRTDYVLRYGPPRYGIAGGMNYAQSISYDRWRNGWLNDLEVAYLKAFRENTP
jgi:hypothetical protein